MQTAELVAPGAVARGERAVESWPRLDGATRLRLVALSEQPRGDELLIGDPKRGEFVVLPAIAGVILDAIRVGKPLAEVESEASEAAGGELDVLDFAQALVELGFVSHVDDRWLGVDSPRMLNGGDLGPTLTALGRRLFSGVAWIVYVVLAVACAAILILEPDFRPSSRSLFFLHDPLASVALIVAINGVLVALHEGSHWLGARVAGAPARITLGRRFYLLVAETDLTSLLAVARRRRFGPLLAGLAFEVVMLTLLLLAQIMARHGIWHPPQTLARLIGALILLRLTGIAFQFLVFLRTDLYAVLVIGLDCVALTRTTQLTLRRLLGRLTPQQTRELAAADRRDLQVARYYRWLYLLGLTVAAWYLVTYAIPWTVTITSWILTSLANAAPDHWRFWESVVFAPLALGPLVLPVIMILREILHRPRPAGHSVTAD
jgi:hypothetical protein